jgi:hypothetical protein
MLKPLSLTGNPCLSNAYPLWERIHSRDERSFTAPPLLDAFPRMKKRRVLCRPRRFFVSADHAFIMR